MKLLLGSANSGKSERVLARVAQTLSSPHGRLLLIVPSTNAANVMRLRLQESIWKNGIQPLKPFQEIQTFPGLYTDLLILTGINLSVIDNLERDRLLRRVIRNLAEEKRLDYFAETADRPGLAASLKGLIDDLWRSGTDANSFARIASQGSVKDRDISLIFERYTKTLEYERLIDAEGAGLMAVRSLESIIHDPVRSASIAKKLSLIAVDGFNFYTPVQVKLLSLLSMSGVEVAATLTYQEGRSVHLWQQLTFQRFREASSEMIELDSIPSNPIERAAALLMGDDHLSSEMANSHLSYLSQQATSEVNQSVVVISAPDRAAEARAVAREIKSLILERAFDPDDITIVCRSISTYAHHLERIFNESAVPLTIDHPLALGRNPLVYAILKLLALASTGFPRRAVLDAMRSPYFDLTSFGLDELSTNLIDRASLARNVTRGEKQWLDAIRETGNEDKGKEDAIDRNVSAEERREKYATIAESLKSFFDSITPTQSASVKSYAQSVRAMIERLNVSDRARQGEEHARDNKALDTLFSLLDRLHIGMASDHESVTRFDNFYTELQHAVDSATFRRVEPEFASVPVQEIHHLLPRRYRAVFALGLIEGEFPAKITETSPYTLVERDELRQRGIDLAETTGDPGADLSQFYRVMASATEMLYLSYARTDLAGGELLRSYLVDEVKAVSECREIRISQSMSGMDESRIISREELASIAARNLRDVIIENGPKALSKLRTSNTAFNILQSELESWPATVRGVMIEYERIERTGNGKYSGFINNSQLLAELRKRLGPDHRWSASQINDYGVCPFRFFAKNLLKVSEASEPSEGFVSTKLGTAYHRVLEQVYTQIVTEEINITIEDENGCIALVEQIAEKTLEDMNEKGEIRKGTFWEFEKREIKRHVAKLLLAESEWNRELPAKTKRLELEFGLKGAPPLVVQCEDGDVKVCGVIDRLDEREDGWVVIDYKLGRTPLHHRDALDGRNLQLPIYVMAAEQMTRDTPVASAYYLHITSRKKGSELPKGSDESLSVKGMISQSEEYIRNYVSRARRGRFPVSPNGNRCFPNCEYEAMCRIQSLGASTTDRDFKRSDDR